MSQQTHVKVPDYEWFDLICLGHAALAQDSPESPTFYLNQILSRLVAFMFPGLRKQIEEYLAEKKYLPEVKLELSK